MLFVSISLSKMAVGIDLHKETHTAVILTCWNEKLGEITIANKPSEFYKLTTKVKKYLTDGVMPVYGLENAYGYGRSLAVWLIQKDYGDSEKCHLSGVLFETERKRKVKSASLNLYCP